MSPRPPTSILAFRNGSIGNTLVAVPALRALRHSFPDARLTVVVEQLGFEMLEHCPWIDRLIVYEKRGRDRGLAAHWRLIRQFREVRPSHAVLFKRFFRNGLLSYLSGARVRAGFVTGGKAPFLNLAIPYDERVHHVDMNLALVEKLGAKPAGQNLELFLAPQDRAAAAALVSRHDVHNGYLCAHFGGSTWFTEKCITRPRFVELLQRIAGNRPVFLIGFGAQENAWAEAIASDLPQAIRAVNLPLRQTAALIQGAELFLGFNSGPSHMAAAVQTPLIMLFESNDRTQSQINRWLPPAAAAEPLVPPADPDTTQWTQFLTEAAAVATSIRRTSPAVRP